MRGESHVAQAPGAPFRDFLLYFLRLGTFGFGGPIALAGHMQRDLVEQRQWISKEDYVEGLAFSQLSPGPLAAQLAMYLGWVRAGRWGATATGIVFILPSFLMVLALAALYVHFGSLSWIQGVFYGIGAAVIAIIIRSAVKLVTMTIGHDWLLWAMFAAVGITTAWTESEFVLLFILCGIIAMAVQSPPAFFGSRLRAAWLPGADWLVSGLHGPVAGGTLLALFLFFAKAGAFVFGSGLAIVPFLYGGVVRDFHWLNERQFLDAVAVAMITPGPVVITAGFVGYLVAGVVGGVLATVAVFAPPFVIVIAGAPFYHRFAKNPHVKAFVQGVTAAAVGAISGAAIVLGRRALIDIPTVLIALTVVTILFVTKRIPEPILILAAGAAGVLLYRGKM